MYIKCNQIKETLLKCKHFGSCGSCNLYIGGYAAQLVEKKQRVEELLRSYYPREVKVYDSPRSHYRARAEFRIWHEGDECYYVMGNMTKDGIERISECPKVIKTIQKRMWKLIECINNSPDVLKKKLFGVEFLATTTDETLVTMLYHRRLDDAWKREVEQMMRVCSCNVIGRSRKQKNSTQ